MQSQFPIALWLSLKIRATGFQNQTFWGLLFLVKNSQARELGMEFGCFTLWREHLWLESHNICGCVIPVSEWLTWEYESWLERIYIPPTISLWLFLCILVVDNFCVSLQVVFMNSCLTSSCVLPIGRGETGFLVPSSWFGPLLFLIYWSKGLSLSRGLLYSGF